MSNETIPITLWVCGRNYRIRIKPEDEESIRLLADKIKGRIKDLKNTYEGKDDQDFLAMALLLYATEGIEEGKSSVGIVVERSLEELNQKLEKSLGTAEA